MDIRPKLPTAKAPSETFTGDAWIDVIARGEEPSRVRVNVVRFAPGARNAWHAHAVGQTVHVVDGVGRIQARGGEIVEIHPGDTIHTPPGEWHWHGAAPDRFMTHLAIWEAPASGPESEWGDQVTDEEYAGNATGIRRRARPVDERGLQIRRLQAALREDEEDDQSDGPCHGRHERRRAAGRDGNGRVEDRAREERAESRDDAADDLRRHEDGQADRADGRLTRHECRGGQCDGDEERRHGDRG